MVRVWRNATLGIYPPFRLELGCGLTTRNDFIGLDIQDFGQEILWDLRNGIPLPDNSVDILYSSHCLEHFTMPELEQILYEILRVCVNNATVKIIVPNGNSTHGKFPCHYTYWGSDLASGIDAWLNIDEPMRFVLLSANATDLTFTCEFKVVKK
jgi:hypothetical protein